MGAIRMRNAVCLCGSRFLFRDKRVKPTKIMELLLDRKYKLKEYTIGKLYVGGRYFCDTLEDKVRELGLDGSGKVKGMTAIPAGRYLVRMDKKSPKYSARPAYYFCEGRVPRLVDVPFFEGILIHIGNTAKDTEGCILVGENKAKGRVLNSTATYKRLWYALEEINKRNENIYITIR